MKTEELEKEEQFLIEHSVENGLEEEQVNYIDLEEMEDK